MTEARIPVPAFVGQAVKYPQSRSKAKRSVRSMARSARSARAMASSSCSPGRTACTRRWSSSPIMMETVRSGLSSTAALSFADSSGEIRCSSTMTPRALRLRSDMRRRT